MYFITKEADLLGKVIAYTHMSQFAEAITIATTDGGIIIIESRDESGEIHVKSEHQASNYILGTIWLRSELLKAGVVTMEDIQEYERQREVVRQQWAKGQEERRRQEYERLKAEFEKGGEEAQ
jgi:hypothetical protein